MKEVELNSNKFVAIYPIPANIHARKHIMIPAVIALYLPIHTSANKPING